MTHNKKISDLRTVIEAGGACWQWADDSIGLVLGDGTMYEFPISEVMDEFIASAEYHGKCRATFIRTMNERAEENKKLKECLCRGNSNCAVIEKEKASLTKLDMESAIQELVDESRVFKVPPLVKVERDRLLALMKEPTPPMKMISKPRMCEVTGWMRDGKSCLPNIGEAEKVVRPATFHGFGADYEEFDNGPGNFSVAIVEYEDGTVDTVIPKHIKFVKEGKK